MDGHPVGGAFFGGFLAGGVELAVADVEGLPFGEPLGGVAGAEDDGGAVGTGLVFAAHGVFHRVAQRLPSAAAGAVTGIFSHPAGVVPKEV